MAAVSSFVRMLTKSRKKRSVSRARYDAQRLKQSTAIYLDATIRSTNIQGQHSLKILKGIVKHTDREILQYIPEKQMILECSLILVQTYVAHLKLRRTFLERLQPQPFVSAKQYFQDLIHLLIPEMQDLVIDTILSFLQRENLWKVEFICVEILMMVLQCQSPASLMLRKMVDYVEDLLERNDILQARHAVIVLQNIIQPEYWSSIDYFNMAKLLRFYHSSAIIGETKNQIYELRRGFEICLRNMIKVLPPKELMCLLTVMLPLTFDTKLSDEDMLEFRTTVEYAAATLKLAGTPRNEETYVLEYLMFYIRSDSYTKSMLACRILTKLLDRGSNFLEFSTPKIFHEDTYYNIDINQCSSARRRIFETQRREFESSMTTAIDLHGSRRINLEIIYNVLCMLLVEVPSGFTACSMTCLLLGVQRRLLDATDEQLDLRHTNRIHAAIISIMTLINWIHRGPSLTAYINTILNRRFDHAPHLNPPLKEIYHYADHHINWNDEMLFFDALELRYGLWKCFRIIEPKMATPTKVYSRLAMADATGKESKQARRKTAFYRIGYSGRLVRR